MISDNPTTETKELPVKKRPSIIKYIHNNKKTSIVVLLIIVSVWMFSDSSKKSDEEQVDQRKKQVETIQITDDVSKKSNLNITGVVQSFSEVDVVSLINGTVRSINFNIGDAVEANSTIIQLHDINTLTSLNNSQLNAQNAQSALNSSIDLSDSVISQSEIAVKIAENSVKNSQEAVKSAEISLITANDNYSNTVALQSNNSKNQSKSNQDLLDNAVVSFYDYLSTAHSVLNDVNYIIKADGEMQIQGIAQTLGAKDKTSISEAKTTYEAAIIGYDSLLPIAPTSDNIATYIGKSSDLLSKVKIAVDKTIIVLDNTVASSTFDETALLTQRNKFTGLRDSVLSKNSVANATKQSMENINLQNIDLLQKQELDRLKNSISSAENQLNLAKIGYNNSLSTLENAKQSLKSSKQNKEQKIISSQNILDSAIGNLNLSRNRANYLNIKAPIKGQITEKYIDIGAEVSAGQKLAKIEQSDMVKIEVGISPEDINFIAENQKVIIRGTLEGYIGRIYPTADSVTKKVKLEIFFDNKNKELIPETFVDLVIEKKLVNQDDKSSTKSSLFAPLQAVIVSQDGDYIYLVDNNKAKKVKVIIGKIDGNFIEIKEGLSSGDILVVEGHRDLSDGEEVEILNSTE